jgi:protein SCO1/2
MLNNRTLFITLGLIAVPLFILWILSYSKQNFNSLQYLGEKFVSETSTRDTTYYQVPPFKFVDQTGEIISEKDLDGYIYVANFFFASCPDVCPMMNAKLATVYERMKEFSEIKFLSISIDPENDSINVLANYAALLNADPTIWKFATNINKQEIISAMRGYLIANDEKNIDQTLHHSRMLVLVDKSRHIRGIYDGLEDIDIKRIKEDIKVLLYDYSEQRKGNKR